MTARGFAGSGPSNIPLHEETVEGALEDLLLKAKNYPRGLQQLLAVRYYLQEILWGCSVRWKQTVQGVTNYKTLLDQIERAHEGSEPVCLVTFNYDTLLEDTLNGFDLEIKKLAHYTKRHRFYRVFKLHGSVNWAHLIRNAIRGPHADSPIAIAQEWIRRAAELDISDDYELCSGGGVISTIEGKPAIPAIAIPVGKTKDFECPPSLIEELKALLPLTTKVLVIGWRAAEQHFLDLLRTCLPRGVYLHIVSGSLADAEETQIRICRALMNSRPTQVSTDANGFSDFMLSGNAETFLREPESFATS